MNQQMQQQSKPVKTKRRWGCMTLICFVFALLIPHTSVLTSTLSELVSLAFYVCLVLWLVAVVPGFVRAVNPRRRVTTEDVYLEQTRLQAQAARDAGRSAASVVQQAPEQIGGMPVLGVVIRDDLHMREPVLLQEVARHEGIRRIILALAGHPPRRR